MCKAYEDYSTVTKQVAAALARGELDYAQELLVGRVYPHEESAFVRILRANQIYLAPPYFLAA